MIELGSMSLRDQDSTADVREKIHGLVRSLGGADVLATRTATAISEMMRRWLQTNGAGTMQIGLAGDDQTMSLQFRVSGTGTCVDIAPLQAFFDRVSSANSSGVSESIAEITMPILPRQVDRDLIASARARIARKSRAELMEELRVKNQQLEAYNESLEATVAERTAELRVANTRMQRDLDAGSVYVRALIPTPMVQPVRIGWKYVPSSSLGGDTIGYHWIDANHLAMYLIDVTGHGLDSALLAVTITNVIRSHSLPSVDMMCPDQVIAALNQAFQGEQHGLKYFTIWYGVYEPRTRQLTWSGGGHHPSVLLSLEAPSLRLLEAGGPIVGCAPEMEYPAESITVSPSSRLLLFSDGIFEILRDDQLVWSLQGAIAYLAQWAGRKDSLLDGLLEHVRDLRGISQLDDDFSIIEAFFD